MIQTTAHNFKDIFTWDEENFCVRGITIPIIQRDYAQGRTTDDVTRIRERFLGVLYNALTTEAKQTLDFVYGNIEQDVLTPLDGQQRLTTLFLLHFYIAKHEDVAEKDYSFLKHFTYETRVSSREFCKHLVNEFSPDFEQDSISEQIKDEAWFLLEWDSDPTVISMLVMLDSIHSKFKHTNGLWKKLMGDSITFYFLPINEMGLTDELYIKMNSRGKPLTQFEHWKAELELALKSVNPGLSKSIAQKIDREWTDLLWPYRNSGTGDNISDNITDDEFLRYIHFISDVISFKNGQSEIIKDFDIIDKHFSSSCQNAEDNAKELIELFDIWLSEPTKNNITGFFQQFFTLDRHEDGKILADKHVDLFAECCRTTGQHINNRRGFAFNRFLLLYSFVLYLKNYNTIEEKDFRRRLRIINNLINNSVDTLRADFITALMKQTEEIIVEEKLEVKEGKAHFNNTQIQEEIVKLEWTRDFPEKAELLFELEDHPLLNGCISVIGLENVEELGKRFMSLFSYDDNGMPNYNFDVISRALFSFGDYGQRDVWRYQLGAPSSPRIWKQMFGPTGDRSKTRTVLTELLRSSETFDAESLNAFCYNFIQRAKTMDWRYYMVKYGSMRKRCGYGKYYWRNKEDQYSLIFMTTEISLSGYNYDVFLYTLYDLAGKDKVGLQLGNYSYSMYHNEGCDKLYMPSKELYLTVESDCYKIFKTTDGNNEDIETIPIQQDDEGNDIVDRIELGFSILNKYLNLWNVEKIKGFIAKCEWTFAKTMANIPHEYIVKGKCQLTDEEFRYFIMAQRSLGVHERWYNYNFPYLYVDGYKYWTMGCSLSETIIINRQKL